jgi:hypothetical protein
MSTPNTPDANAQSAPAPIARFLTGSLMRHVLVMAGTGAVGLVAVFAVDLINLFYISRLVSKPLPRRWALPEWWRFFTPPFASA